MQSIQEGVAQHSLLKGESTEVMSTIFFIKNAQLLCIP